MDNLALAQLLFPDVADTPDQIEARYPDRSLPDGARVTRMAPSPTGFMHLGNLLAAVTAERLAHQSGGVFFLRIEDTDQKREVEGGVEAIISAFDSFRLNFDEGAGVSVDTGNYGPYRQRQRAGIYHIFAKKLVEAGCAYPCFCTEAELEDMRNRQSAEKANFGYYGKWALYRDCGLDVIHEKLNSGEPYVLRLRSSGDPSRKFRFTDLVKGKMELPENDMDIVLLKSDGIPTYHFAHAVDDHLMKTTHVVRGDEWLATLPVHVQLFEMLGWKHPEYLHIAPLMKMDGSSKRKLSKRHDPELALDYYDEQGYPVDSVLEYLFTILNSNFEQWRTQNPLSPIGEFEFTAAKMSASGALFDIAKLNDVSKNLVSRMTADRVFDQAADWCSRHDSEFHALLTLDPAYSKSIFAIGRGAAKPRRDITVWRDVRGYMDFFFDELFCPEYEYPTNVSEDDRKEIIKRYQTIYNSADDQSAWFDRIKALAGELGFAPETKLYKADPDSYKGHVGDVSMVIRVAVSGRQNSPDMFDVMRILGPERVAERLNKALMA